MYFVFDGLVESPYEFVLAEGILDGQMKQQNILGDGQYNLIWQLFEANGEPL